MGERKVCTRRNWRKSFRFWISDFGVGAEAEAEVGAPGPE